MQTWDLKEVSTIFGPYTIEDYADGDVITVAKNSVTFTDEPGATGEYTRSKTNDKGGTITIRLKQTSPQNANFSKLMLADELSNSGIVPFTYIDNAGSDVFVAPHVWIEKPPDANRGQASGMNEWVFKSDNVSMFFGGNPNV